eukprot:c11689_g1_i2.p1 GENE.c11689_g1_i2~~c11689_g1_i2.p1  ORF type:complete len:581 (+),score=134.59 c11689_g1_i2:1302-3044(+)
MSNSDPLLRTRNRKTASSSVMTDESVGDPLRSPTPHSQPQSEGVLVSRARSSAIRSVVRNRDNTHVSTSASSAFNLRAASATVTSRPTANYVFLFNTACAMAQFTTLLICSYRIYTESLQGAPALGMGWMPGLYFACEGLSLSLLTSLNRTRIHMLVAAVLCLLGSSCFVMSTLPLWDVNTRKGLMFAAYCVLGVSHGLIHLQTQTQVFRSSSSLTSARKGLVWVGMVGCFGQALGSTACVGLSDGTVNMPSEWHGHGMQLLTPTNSPALLVLGLGVAIVLATLTTPPLTTSATQSNDFSSPAHEIGLRHQRLVGPRCELAHSSGCNRFTLIVTKALVLAALTANITGTRINQVMLTPMLVNGDVCGSPFNQLGCVFSQQQISIVWTIVTGCILIGTYIVTHLSRNTSVSLSFIVGLSLSVAAYMLMIDWAESVSMWMLVGGLIVAGITHHVTAAAISCLHMQFGWWGGWLLNWCTFLSTSMPFILSVVFDAEQQQQDTYGPTTYFSIPIISNLIALLLLACVISNRLLFLIPTPESSAEWTPLVNQSDEHSGNVLRQSGVPVVPHGCMMILSLIDPLKL